MDYQVINHTKELAGARTHEQENSWHALQWVLPSPSKESQPLSIHRDAGKGEKPNCLLMGGEVKGRDGGKKKGMGRV